jgi:hypothetical protein
MRPLLQHCAAAALSLMLTLDTAHGRFPESADHGVSNLADNVVLLQLPRDGGRLAHTMSVLNTRASDHDAAVREFVITEPASSSTTLEGRAGQGSTLTADANAVPSGAWTTMCR